MSSLKINGKEYNDIQLVKLQKGKTDEAIKTLNSGAQGADDVVFKVGDDAFVASGRDIFPGKPTAGAVFMGGEGITVELDGKKADVIGWDNQANNGKECAQWAGLRMSGFAMLGTMVSVMLLRLGNLKSLVIGGVGLAGSLIGAYLYGDNRKLNVSEQAKLGTVLQENTQSAGGWGAAIKNITGK